MKKYAVLLVFLLAATSLFAQDVAWTSVIAGQREEYGNAICLDADHNVIVTGSFQDICYGGTFALSSYGSTDIFVQKLSNAGAVLWTRQFGSSGADNGFSVATDSSGNIYVAGIYTGNVLFGSGSLSGSNNFFVIKLDPSGNVLWRKAIPGYSSAKPKLTVDSTNNLFLTGTFTGTRNFDSFTLDALDGLAFVSKLNTNNGSVLWITQFGSGSSFNGTPVVVNVTTSNFTTDRLGNIYVTGCFKDHGRFGSQQIISSISASNTYILKMNSVGNILWTKVFTGPTEGTSIVTDSENNIYTAGNYYGQVAINNNTYIAPAGNYSAYFEKLDTNGNLIWFKNYDLNTTVHYDAAPQLAISGPKLFFKCLFANTIAFENHTFTNLVSTEPYNYYKPQILAAFNNNGDNLWVNQYESANDNTSFGIYADKATNIAIDQSGLYFTSGNSNFNDVSYSLESGANIFIAKLNATFLNDAAFERENGGITVAPNPTQGKININLAKSAAVVEINVFNSIGQRIDTFYRSNTNAATIDIGGGSGIFFVEIKADHKTTVTKVIKR